MSQANPLWGTPRIHGELLKLGIAVAQSTVARYLPRRKPPSQGRKSLRLSLAGLRIRRFDPIAEASELPDHFRSAPLLRLFGDGWASLFVTNSLVQEQPDQATLSMGNGPDGLLMSQGSGTAGTGARGSDSSGRGITPPIPATGRLAGASQLHRR